jgi:hypothetical protein
MRVVVELIDETPPPKYQTIAEPAARLKQLGFSGPAIARALGVTGKTVRKAICWFQKGDPNRVSDLQT